MSASGAIVIVWPGATCEGSGVTTAGAIVRAPEGPGVSTDGCDHGEHEPRKDT